MYEEVGTSLHYDTMHLSEWSLFLDNSHGLTWGKNAKQCDSETQPPSSKIKMIDKTIIVASGGRFDFNDCVNSAMKIIWHLLLHLKLDDTEAVGVLNNLAWDAVSDQLHLEKVWDNSNAIKSDDSL
ncbi:hypothetical protein EV424DRAFT_1345480 [Suillus variegatus]|nr:hypothetical protein EV424DRAFT_1345480 [Suillus variegatus]